MFYFSPVSGFNSFEKMQLLMSDIPIVINTCVYLLMLCSHFIADFSVNAQKLLEMTIGAKLEKSPEVRFVIQEKKIFG